MSTTIERNAVLRSNFGADRHSTLSLPTLYFGLLDAHVANGGVEPDSTGGYARVAITNDATFVGTIGSSDVVASNIIAVTWPVATGVYSITDPLTHWGIWDNSSGGNLWYCDELIPEIIVTGAGDQPRIPIGTWVATVPNLD